MLYVGVSGVKCIPRLAYFVSAYHANSVERRARPFLRSDPTTGLPGASRLHMPRDQYAEYVKGGVNLDHFGGAKVDQLVKG